MQALKLWHLPIVKATSMPFSQTGGAISLFSKIS
jgi:hypothetical protein